MFCAKTQLASSDGAGEEVELSSKELVPGDQILLPATGGKHQHQHPPPPRHHYLLIQILLPATGGKHHIQNWLIFWVFLLHKCHIFSCLVHLGKKCQTKLSSSSEWHDAQFSWVSFFLVFKESTNLPSRIHRFFKLICLYFILLKSGYIVECDAVLVSGSAVANESMLTGESIPVTKVTRVKYCMLWNDNENVGGAGEKARNVDDKP